MSDREKLIELLSVSEEYSCCYGDIVVGCTGCEYEKEEDCFLARLADHLISNGVTVQKWIPVSERLPRPYVNVNIVAYLENECGSSYRVVSVGWYSDTLEVWSILTSDGSVIDIKVTHWMPLPEPPKECE